jgi:hypothetical protein
MSELQDMQETEDIEAIETKATRGNARGLVSKAASGSSEDVALAFDEFMRAFEAFKVTNDERLTRHRAEHFGRRCHHREARPDQPGARSA